MEYEKDHKIVKKKIQSKIQSQFVPLKKRV